RDSYSRLRTSLRWATSLVDVFDLYALGNRRSILLSYGANPRTRRAYLCVVVMDPWPSSSCSATNDPPASSHKHAYVCRSWCGWKRFDARKPSAPASEHRGVAKRQEKPDMASESPERDLHPRTTRAVVAASSQVMPTASKAVLIAVTFAAWSGTGSDRKYVRA